MHCCLVPCQNPCFFWIWQVSDHTWGGWDDFESHWVIVLKVGVEAVWIEIVVIGRRSSDGGTRQLTRRYRCCSLLNMVVNDWSWRHLWLWLNWTLCCCGRIGSRLKHKWLIEIRFLQKQCRFILSPLISKLPHLLVYFYHLVTWGAGFSPLGQKKWFNPIGMVS